MTARSAARTSSTAWPRITSASSLHDHDGAGDAGVVRHRHVHRTDAQLGGAGGNGSHDLERGPAVPGAHHGGVGPAQADRRAERLGERLLGREPRSQRHHRQVALSVGEQPLEQARGPGQRLAEAFDVHDVDADAHDHAAPAARSRSIRATRPCLLNRAYSTVTDLARLRGWSMSRPLAIASSPAKTCRGTVVTSGASRVGVRGTSTSVSAYGATSVSPSSAMTIVRAPRARISWMLETTLPCSESRPRGDGTTTNTGSPSSISAIGPCLSSPAAKPSAWMYASSLSLSAPSRATGKPTCRPRKSTTRASAISRAIRRTWSIPSSTCWICCGTSAS